MRLRMQDTIGWQGWDSGKTGASWPLARGRSQSLPQGRTRGDGERYCRPLFLRHVRGKERAKVDDHVGVS